RIALYKSAKYTVERPLHLGAALAERLDEFQAALTAIGVPLRAAFQLRDDVLGAFGESDVTGQPVGDDLPERRATRLVSLAAARAPRRTTAPCWGASVPTAAAPRRSRRCRTSSCGPAR